MKDAKRTNNVDGSHKHAEPRTPDVKEYVTLCDFIYMTLNVGKVNLRCWKSGWQQSRWRAVTDYQGTDSRGLHCCSCLFLIRVDSHRVVRVGCVLCFVCYTPSTTLRTAAAIQGLLDKALPDSLVPNGESLTKSPYCNHWLRKCRPHLSLKMRPNPIFIYCPQRSKAQNGSSTRICCKRGRAKRPERRELWHLGKTEAWDYRVTEFLDLGFLGLQNHEFFKPLS